MESKKTLKKFFDSNKEKFEYIDMFEKNKNFFNELLKNGHVEDFDFAISVKIFKYADPLNQTGHYKKALSILYEIENDLEKFKGQFKWYKMYSEHTTFLKGVCLGRLKRYRESNVEFKKILELNQNNDRYKEWYKSNMTSQINEILNTIALVGLILFIILIITDFTGPKIENKTIKYIIMIVAFIAVTLTYILGKIINRKSIKINKNAT